MSSIAEVILFAYGGCNALRVVSYVPQIVRIVRDREGARAISLSTWWLWISANATTALYAWVNLGDAPLALLNALNTICCLVVVAMTTWKRITIRCEMGSSQKVATTVDGKSLSPARQRCRDCNLPELRHNLVAACHRERLVPDRHGDDRSRSKGTDWDK